MDRILSKRSSWGMAAMLMCCSSLHAAQPTLPFDLKQLSIGLPEAGAPLAVVGPYAVTAETPSDSARAQGLPAS